VLAPKWTRGPYWPTEPTAAGGDESRECRRHTLFYVEILRAAMGRINRIGGSSPAGQREKFFQSHDHCCSREQEHDASIGIGFAQQREVGPFAVGANRGRVFDALDETVGGDRHDQANNQPK
jgi:hypothetical protein